MKTLTDILNSVQSAHKSFRAEAIDSALKITMGGGETAYIPNIMREEAFRAYHIILNIPLPAHDAAQAAALSESDALIAAAIEEAAAPPEKHAARPHDAPIIIADAGERSPAARRKPPAEEWEEAAYRDYISVSPVK